MGVIMDRNLRYHRLPSEEPTNQLSPPLSYMEMSEEESAVGSHHQHRVNSEMIGRESPSADSSGVDAVEAGADENQAVLHPPPYSSSAEGDEDANTSEVPKYDPSMPPSYSVATVLPTYEQVEQLKRQEVVQVDFSSKDPCINLITQLMSVNDEHLTEKNWCPLIEIVPIDAETLEKGDNLLGTDFMFLCAFFVSFLFNWIGFLMLMCFCPTIAGRYGALAGFGLSLAKWTLIVKHSTELVSMDNNWLWWLILAFGVLICVRAVLQYLNVKREWHLLTRATQQRLMYFY